MTFTVINLFGEQEPEKAKKTKKESELAPRIERDHELMKQVINIKGEIVTI